MTVDFKRSIRPGTIPTDAGAGRQMSIFCTIKFKNGRLSITGVEGPTSNGNCAGSCGQIVMSLREDGALDGFAPADGWSLELFTRFLSVWDEWHLNDMRPYDAQMMAAGWRDKAAKVMKVYSYELTMEALKAKRDAEAAAMAALKSGSPFAPSRDQIAAANQPFSCQIVTYADEAEPVAPDGYRRKRHITGHMAGAVAAPEEKTLGWLRPSEHPDGLLTRKLHQDGPGYGQSWFKHEVPADVLEFLQSLPVADRANPWRD